MKKCRHLYKDKIINLYIEFKQSINKIAKVLKLNRETVTLVLRENKIPVRQKQGLHSFTYSFDSKFFEKIDSEEKAYWLGFMYADGYITKKNTMGLNLSEKDESHLYKFKKSLESTHPINKYKTTSGYKKGSSYCCLIIGNTENYENLVNCGIVKNKTHVLTFPNNSIVPDNLIHHFIRGYFDGDGSVSIHKCSYVRKDGTSQNKISCSVLGTEKFLLDLVSKIDFKQKIYKSKNIHFISFAGKKAIDFYYYIYKDATIYLDRKKDKFEEYFGGKISN